MCLSKQSVDRARRGRPATSPSSSSFNRMADSSLTVKLLRWISVSKSVGSKPNWSSKKLSDPLISRVGPSPDLNSSSMSWADSTSLAPCLISAWQPLDCGECIEPGTAKTSRPCSAARRAVIREPLCSEASTTKQPLLSPLIIRFRLGKLPASGGVPSGNSDTIAPNFAKRCASSLFCEG